ncbi:MAG: DMT family transporter [Rhizobiaceae bacterium]|nr:DMT family transporter [Rhizobiaceae bacterium]
MATNRDASTAKAALWMGAWLALMLGMTWASREVTREISVLQLMELRSVIGFFMLLPLVFSAGGFAAMKTSRPLAHISRNVAHYIGQALWLYALTLIPLAHLISIEFTTPLWTALLAVVFLGETLNSRKIGAIALGLVGVAIIVRPGATEIDPGHLVVLAAALTFAVSVVLVKSLTRTESVVAIIFWMLVIQSAIGLVPALSQWRWPSQELWPWIATAAFCGSFAHYCQARALVHADATVVVPMDFLRVPLTALLGFLVYNESLDMMTALGAALILCGNLLNLQRKPVPATV